MMGVGGVFPGLFGGGVTPATTENRKKPPFRERDLSCFVGKSVSGSGLILIALTAY